MAKSHSYGATLKNNKTENEAVLFLLQENPCFRLPSKEERKEILNALDLPSSFSRAYDLVLLPLAEQNNTLSLSSQDWSLVELKTTKKKIINLPEGFFFGATENEFRLAEILGDRYQFCFVSLHPESKGYILLTAKELEGRVKTKRIQYQINL